MSEHTLRPIWTPEDARQAARDAAKHTAHRGEAIPTEPLESGTRISWQPYFDEPATDGVIADVIPDAPHFGLLYTVAWSEAGRTLRANITPDRVLAIASTSKQANA